MARGGPVHLSAIGCRNCEPASFLESDLSRLSRDWLQFSQKPFTGNLDIKAIAAYCSWQDHPIFVVGYSVHGEIIVPRTAFLKFQSSVA